MNESATKPHVIVVAGPNGAGKSTSAPYFLRDALEVTEFVNADAIAGGLSAFSPESVAIGAGRIMLERMRDLAADRTDFAFETTLAGRGLARFLADLQSKGYHVHVQGLRNLFWVYMPMADSWQYFDNSHLALPSLLAERTREGHVSMIDEFTWCILEETYDG